MAGKNYTMDIVKEAAKELGLDLEFRPGKRHWKVFLGERMVMVLPHGNPRNQGRAIANDIARLRRIAEGREAEDRQWKPR